MGIKLRKAQFFDKFTFPGLLNQRSAFVDEDGIWHFPAWMCEMTHSASMGYGPDEEYPCGEKADHIVTFVALNPNCDELDKWDECTERVCWSHFDQMVSYVAENPEEIKIVHIVDICDLRDRPTKPVNLRHWGRYTTQRHSVRIDI